MNNDRQNKDKQSFNRGKYLQIALILMIIAIGIIRFGLPRSNGGVGVVRNSSNQMAIEYYIEKYGDGVDEQEVTAVTKNLGCHREIQVFRDGKIVMRSVYSNGQIYEIE